jgi:hypothetical protein
MKLRTIFLWSLIISLSLAAAIGVVAILMPGFGRTQERILVTSLIVGGFSLPALSCSIVLGRRRFVALMWVGIASAFAAAALWAVVTWWDAWIWSNNWDELVIKSAITFTMATVWIMHCGLFRLLRLDRPAHRPVRAATVALVAVLGALLLYVFWWEDYDEWSGRTAGVLAILSTCGTIVTPILALLELIARRAGRESIPSRVKLAVRCPRCGAEQVLAAGSASCAGCGLRILIDIEEPRCACGYLLYRLEGEVCPECGRSIPSGERWNAPPAATGFGTAAATASPSAAPSQST